MHLVAWFCSISKKTYFILKFFLSLSHPTPSFSSSNLIDLRWSSSSEILCCHCSVFYLAEEAVVFFISFIQGSKMLDWFFSMNFHLLVNYSFIFWVVFLIFVFFICVVFMSLSYLGNIILKSFLDIFRFPSNFYFRKIAVLCRCWLDACASVVIFFSFRKWSTEMKKYEPFSHIHRQTWMMLRHFAPASAVARLFPTLLQPVQELVGAVATNSYPSSASELA